MNHFKALFSAIILFYFQPVLAITVYDMTSAYKHPDADTWLSEYCENGQGVFYNSENLFATQDTKNLYKFGCYKYKVGVTEQNIKQDIETNALANQGILEIIKIPLIKKEDCDKKTYPDGWTEAVYTGDDCMAYNCNNSQGYYLNKEENGVLTCKKKTYNDNDDCLCVYHQHGYATKCKYTGVLGCTATECKPGYKTGDMDKCTEPDTTNIVQKNANKPETQSYSESYEAAKQALEALYTQAKNAISKINQE